MNRSLVVVDSNEGSLDRYEFGDAVRAAHASGAVKTHSCLVAEDTPLPVEFTVDVVEGFRLHPPGEFYVRGPAPVPGGDTPGGGTPAAVAA